MEGVGDNEVGVKVGKAGERNTEMIWLGEIGIEKFVRVHF